MRNVAEYSRSRTQHEILQNIPGAEPNEKCCRIFQELDTIRKSILLAWISLTNNFQTMYRSSLTL